MTTLFCNKRGDQRFWDEVATVEVNGVQDTIANHFKKATETSELIIDGFKYERKFARSFYNLMWVKYLDQNPVLIQVASRYRNYAGNSADVISTYIKDSRAAVVEDEDMKEFVRQMRANARGAKSSNTQVNAVNTNSVQQQINTDENIITIALTGHRPEKLDGYNLYSPFYIELAKQLRSIVLQYLSVGKRVHMITGMALGADTLWALVGLKLKQQGYAVTLEAAIPCAEQYSRWAKEDQDRWHDIVKKADKVTYVSNKPYSGYLMQKCSEYMVDQCEVLVSVWDGTKSGTKNCIDYMKKCNGIDGMSFVDDKNNRNICHISINPNQIKKGLGSSLIYVDGDLLASDCDIIMHQANCQSVMNAGIAKSIRQKYPDAFLVDKADPRSPEERLGGYTSVTEDGRTIVNLYGQFGYGRGENYTNYGALEHALYTFLSTVEGTPKIGLPYNMGCGLAGGDWNVVESILKRITQTTDHKFYIYKLN